MHDTDIVELYWQRSDKAIEESSKKYGNYCFSIARNICGAIEDAEECVNDTWFKAWNLMPDNRPSVLSSFLGCITRSISLDRVKTKSRLKRGRGQITIALEELEECIPDSSSVEKSFELRELETAILNYLNQLSETEKLIFISRYWYLAPMSEISEKLNFSQSKVKSTLFRLRKKLKSYLEEESLC